MPISTGVNRWTGKPLSDWSHVEQSLQVIFSTRIGERVMRRTFGSSVPQLLGRNLTEPTILRFFAAICMAVDLWEPRFRVTQILPTGTPSQMRLGQLGLTIVGEYRPNALLGDFTPEPTPFQTRL